MVSGAIYGLLAFHSMPQLITVYNWLRVATTVMTVLAAWQLRRKMPDLKRTFMIPGGTPGLLVAVVAVVIMSAVALTGSLFGNGAGGGVNLYGLLWGPVALSLGPVVYSALQWRKPTLSGSK
jgi:hypothetical protein